MIADKELAQLFKAESAEHLACLDDGLLRLEKTPSDQPLLEAVFRASHSLKGAARMLGLSKIEAAAHGLETILNTARKGEATITRTAVDSMTVALGELRKLVDIECGVNESGVPNSGQLNADSGVRNAANAESSTQSGIRVPQSNIPPSVAPQSAIGHSETRAFLEKQRAHSATMFAGESPAGLAPLFAAKPPAVTLSTPHSDVSQSIAPSEFKIETVRVETRKLDDLLTLAGELSVVAGRGQHRLSLMDELLEQWEKLKRDFGVRYFEFGLHNAGHSSRQSSILNPQSTDIAIERFGIRLQKVRDALSEECARLDFTVNALDERVSAMRLLPLSTVFALFPRMVHDLARELGKEVDLLIEGGEISVDKRILEEMKDPLMHLLRNAIDHGIESQADRELQGKPRVGTLRLRATRDVNRVLLEVRDDGRGLDIQAIAEVAMQRGLFDAAALAAMPVTQLQQLIFMSGFTTCAHISELSGRGVGLDVVRNNVDHLKGEIRIESSLHQGTAVQVRVPLSLASTRLLIAAVGQLQYGLPVEFVHSSRYLLAADIFTLEGCPAIELDGQGVIAPRLSDLLDLTATGSETVCIVLQIGDERIGLRVDALLDEQEVLAKPLCAPLLRVRNVSSLAILSSGDICAVLNPVDLLLTAHRKLHTLDRKGLPSERMALNEGAGRTVTAAATEMRRNAQSGVEHKMNAELEIRKDDLNPLAGASQSARRILLVEDSALVRAMEQRILESAGYQVVSAADGVDALEALAGNAFAAVVSDINMPNMDGLMLTARIRSDARYKDLPVVLVTTLASDEDKRRGLEAGASAYIPKPSFDQRALLDTLKRLI